MSYRIRDAEQGDILSLDEAFEEIESMKPTVPWTGFDVLLFFAIWLAALMVSGAVAFTDVRPQASENTQDHGHPITQLIEQGKNSPVVLVVVFLAAVVVAPLIEEFLFRMLFLGWLEAKFKHIKLPCASGIAIVLVSLCFAAIHANNHDVIDVPSMLIGLIVSSVVSLMVFAAGITYLAQVRNVRIADYLFGSWRFVRFRFVAGAGYCLMAIVFIYGLQAALLSMFPGTNVSPIPLFVFALVLGLLYSRTQNLSYCILLHACLNGISLALLVWYKFT